MAEAKLDIEKSWRRTNSLSDTERRGLVGFLFGYCASNEQFLEAVDRYLAKYIGRKRHN